MFNLFKRNKKSLNTVGHCGGNRGVVPERGHAPSSVTPYPNGMIKKPVPPISEQKMPTKPNKQPYVRIEFDDINNPTVWIDGDKVEALETLDVNWETDRRNRNSFGISYTDSNDACVVSWQDNTQSSCVDGDKSSNDASEHALGFFAKDIAEVIERINEAKKDGAILLVISGSLFRTDINTLENVIGSMGYRCTTAKLAFEGEQISERLLITIEE